MARTPAIDRDCCIGCEVCTQICPDVFRMEGEAEGHDHAHGDDHGKAEVHNPAGAPEEMIEQAMDSCPGACIYWDD